MVTVARPPELLSYGHLVVGPRPYLLPYVVAQLDATLSAHVDLLELVEVGQRTWQAYPHGIDTEVRVQVLAVPR